MERKIAQQTFPVQTQIVEEETQPLPTLRSLAFRAFLEKHGLSWLDVALAAHVRLLTVWNVARDYPISGQQAEMVRMGLYHLTGVRYRGGMALRVDQANGIAAEGLSQGGNG